MVGPVGTSVTPQLSVTGGGDGTTIVPIQLAVALVGGMAGKGRYSIVYV
jgi:hypothetical protein